jgi:hypothetical protein
MGCNGSVLSRCKQRAGATVVMTVRTALAVIAAISRFGGNEKGQDGMLVLPHETGSQTAAIPAKANLKGQKFWNEME